ncbi:NUDIX hydrolase [Amycolatopsis sp. NPDC004079]|uniref:NUDIX hydrolase n=1 Tax=Amycolatopsis sp. NPDC004079 TaxID=3154549 RepID=UPI0033B459F5
MVEHFWDGTLIPSSPWALLARRELAANPFANVRVDTVRRPDGSIGPYLAVDTADMVRILAVCEGHVLIVEQHHYLTGPCWQLPGGRVDPSDGGMPGLGPDPMIAAARELLEETSISGRLTRLATWEPLPALTASRTHVYLAADVRTDDRRAQLDDTEADLAKRWIPVRDAIAATLDGRVRCAPSAAAILTLALRPRFPRRRLRRRLSASRRLGWLWCLTTLVPPRGRSTTTPRR